MQQILFCLETNERADTDYAYIKKTIEFFCDLSDKKISYRPVYMGSKSRYNSKDVERSIKKYSKDFKGKINVIYCVDLDRWDSKPDDLEDLRDIKKFCSQKGYDLIFFGRDIENVYLGQSIPASEKKASAQKFLRKGEIKAIDSSKLSCSSEGIGKSNILLILKKYFKMKL